MRALFDVNVLLALLQPDHAHHEDAQQWWAANRTAGWASCPITQNGFVRIISQPRYPKPMTLAVAIGVFAELIQTTDHRFWPDDISVLDAHHVDPTRILGPGQITDIYLVALAAKNGGRFVTFDRAISVAAVRGATDLHIVVIEGAA
jgi:uncharacterized protein